MNRLLLAIGIAVVLFSCSPKSDVPKNARELEVGQSLEMEWGKCTLNEKEGIPYLFLEVAAWSKNGVLNLPGVKTKVNDIFLQSKPDHHFAWRFYKGELQIHISSVKPDEANVVLVVKTKGGVKVSGNPV